MAKQSSQRLSAHKAVKTKSSLTPMVRVTGQKVAKPKETARTQVMSGTQFVVWQRRQRTDLVVSEATKAGLIGGPKNTVIRGRVSTKLVKAAKKRAGVTSD